MNRWGSTAEFVSSFPQMKPTFSAIISKNPHFFNFSQESTILSFKK